MMRRTLLLFAGEDRGIAGWLLLEGEAVVARGRGAPLPEEAAEGEDPLVVLAVPGEHVAIHWADLPSLSDAQARAAARLLAGDVSAGPVEGLHVAVGPEGDAGRRAMALVEAELLAGWLGAAQAAGLDPDHVVPDPMLIPAPEEGVAIWASAGRWLVRAPMLAVAADADVAPLLTEGMATRVLDDAAFEAGIPQALAATLLDLRQGVFARRRRWRPDWAAARRIAMIAGLIVVAILATQLALIARYSFAADRLEAETAAISGGGQRAAGGQGGIGFGPSSAMLFAAVRDTANVELSALRLDPDGALRATVMASDPAEVAALAQRLSAAGLTVDSGAARPGAGHQIAELTMRAQ